MRNTIGISASIKVGFLVFSVMEIIRDHGFNIKAECGGCCSCATCHVHVEAEWVGAVGEPSDNEESMLDLNPERLANSRLCCQIKVTESLGGLVVRVPEFQF